MLDGERRAPAPDSLPRSAENRGSCQGRLASPLFRSYPTATFGDFDKPPNFFCNGDFQ